MQDTHDARSILDAAERAAAAGDYPTAERLLRDAALEQEAELGPLHPALANTLNNLGVVCERLDKLGDAERSYRRAHEIAAAALPADHPFVATSRKNLDDFHKAHVHDAKAQVHDANRLNLPPTAEAGRVAPQDEPAAAVPHDEPVAPVPQLPPMAIDARASESESLSALVPGCRLERVGSRRSGGCWRSLRDAPQCSLERAAGRIRAGRLTGIAAGTTAAGSRTDPDQ